MTIDMVLIAATVGLFGGAAAIALAWAMSRGQLRDFQRGATSIFDADEPVGRVTDTALDPESRRHG